VCGLGLGLVEGSARQSCGIIHHIHFFSNLPSGFATWHNLFFFFVCDFVQGSTIDQNGHGGHQIQDQVKMIL
jgi:hypothetical protein